MNLRHTSSNRVMPICSVLALLVAAPAGLLAQTGAETELHRAYFLEKESGQFAAARELYRGVLAKGVSEELQRVAQRGSDRCRDALAAQNFSQLMPADALAYIELNRPGRFIEQLAGLIGLTTEDMRQLLDQRPNQDSRQVAFIPGRIAISPSMFDYLSCFGGAAVALTDFDPSNRRAPTGVLVLHHGDASLLKGALETAFQFAPLGQKIRDLPTFGADVPNVGRLTGVLTESLLILGNGTELIEGVVDRLIGERADSLAACEDLADLSAQRKGAAIFAYCDLQGIIRRVTANLPETDRGELKVIDGLVDLDSLQWAAFSLGIQEQALGLRFAIRLADDHRCIAYNLMRLPAMTGQCLKLVPSDAAVVFGMGLNPALTMAAADAAQSRSPATAVTGLEIFREFFGNVRELSAFVVTGDAGPKGTPNACVLMAVNDVARSRALWDQFLRMPGILEGNESVEAREVKLGETTAYSYAIPDFGNVYLTEIDGCIAISVTRNALKAALRARSRNQSIDSDPQLGKVISSLPRDTSIFAVAHIGRCIRIGAGTAGNPAAAMPANMAADLCARTVAWFGLGQAPNEMSVQVAVSGLPNVNEAIEKFGPMINAFLPNMPRPSKDHQTLVRKEGGARRAPPSAAPTKESSPEPATP